MEMSLKNSKIHNIFYIGISIFLTFNLKIKIINYIFDLSKIGMHYTFIKYNSSDDWFLFRYIDLIMD